MAGEPAFDTTTGKPVFDPATGKPALNCGGGTTPGECCCPDTINVDWSYSSCETPGTCPGAETGSITLVKVQGCEGGVDGYWQAFPETGWQLVVIRSRDADICHWSLQLATGVDGSGTCNGIGIPISLDVICIAGRATGVFLIPISKFPGIPCGTLTIVLS